MSTIQEDFDRLALVSEDGATHNDHYHNFLLRHLPSNCHNVLEIGCGTGTFARRLAERSEHVLAFDLSPEMIRLARERSSAFANIEFELVDVRDYPLPAESFDCIGSIATLHHLPYEEMLVKMKDALKPGGVLVILDLFEPASLRTSLSSGSSDSSRTGIPACPVFANPPKSDDASAFLSDSQSRGLADPPSAGLSNSLSAGPADSESAGLSKSPVVAGVSTSLWAGLSDSLLNFVAIPVSGGLRLIHHGRLFPRREERAAWSAHEHHDSYLTMTEVRALCTQILPGAEIKQHLLWRYSIVWQKPANLVQMFGQ